MRGFFDLVLILADGPWLGCTTSPARVMNDSQRHPVRMPVYGASTHSIAGTSQCICLWKGCRGDCSRLSRGEANKVSISTCGVKPSKDCVSEWRTTSENLPLANNIPECNRSHAIGERISPLLVLLQSSYWRIPPTPCGPYPVESLRDLVGSVCAPTAKGRFPASNAGP